MRDDQTKHPQNSLGQAITQAILDEREVIIHTCEKNLPSDEMIMCQNLMIEKICCAVDTFSVFRQVALELGHHAPAKVFDDAVKQYEELLLFYEKPFIFSAEKDEKAFGSQSDKYSSSFRLIDVNMMGALTILSTTPNIEDVVKARIMKTDMRKRPEIFYIKKPAP